MILKVALDKPDSRKISQIIVRFPKMDCKKDISKVFKSPDINYHQLITKSYKLWQKYNIILECITNEHMYVYYVDILFYSNKTSYMQHFFDLPKFFYRTITAALNGK